MYNLIIQIEGLFKGNTDQWQDVFFAFPDDYTAFEQVGAVLGYCEANEWDVEIKYTRET